MTTRGRTRRRSCWRTMRFVALSRRRSSTAYSSGSTWTPSFARDCPSRRREPPRAGGDARERGRPRRGQAAADAEGADALAEHQQARPRGCREGAGGQGSRQERKRLDRERKRHARPETADHAAGDAARRRGQAEGERRSERRPGRDPEVEPARDGPEGGEGPPRPELAARHRRPCPLRAGDLSRAGAAQAACSARPGRASSSSA